MLMMVKSGMCMMVWSIKMSRFSVYSLLVNTDRVALNKSSKASIWPVWLVINEESADSLCNWCKSLSTLISVNSDTGT